MLQDTRSRPDVNETIFEDPDLDSDAESDSERQMKLDKAEARRGLIGNHGAGISRADLGRDHSDDEEEGEDAVLVGRRRDLEEADLDSEHEGGLSAKVGIILVRVQRPLFVVARFVNSVPGHSKHICCDTPVLCDWTCFDRFCDLRPSTSSPRSRWRRRQF